MRLVYKGTNKPVRLGDHVRLHETMNEVVGIQRPHKPESTGRVIVRPVDEPAPPVSGMMPECTYFPSVIGAEWIEREDR